MTVMKNERTAPSVRFQVSSEDCSRLLETENLPASAQLLAKPGKLETYSAFTLVELLVVISIISIIAAFLLPVAGAVKKKAVIHTAQTEMAQLETAIDRYKAAYGFYPPDSAATVNNIPISQLYYELEGTTYDPTNQNYTTLDSSAQIAAADVPKVFSGVNGFVNCSKPGTDESVRQAKNFLPDLKPRRIGTITNKNAPGELVAILITSVGGPDRTYPWGVPDLNPWRYISQGTNNPGSYDLWVQLSITGTTNLICNWSKQVQINSPMP